MNTAARSTSKGSAIHWNANWVASLAPEARTKLLASLTGDELQALSYDWAFWARGNQLPPEGAWRVWLILAGRGFGKTRCGAEWVRAQVSAGSRRIALVAATAADARDVMVEGESGVLAISPPWAIPNKQPE